jgi:hypothetical protein
MTKKQKPELPKWMHKTVTALDIVKVILDADMETEPAVIRAVAIAMSKAFDFTDEEQDEFLKAALIDGDDDEENAGNEYRASSLGRSQSPLCRGRGPERAVVEANELAVPCQHRDGACYKWTGRHPWIMECAMKHRHRQFVTGPLPGSCPPANCVPFNQLGVGEQRMTRKDIELLRRALQRLRWGLPDPSTIIVRNGALDASRRASMSHSCRTCLPPLLVTH